MSSPFDSKPLAPTSITRFEPGYEGHGRHDTDCIRLITEDARLFFKHSSHSSLYCGFSMVIFVEDGNILKGPDSSMAER